MSEQKPQTSALEQKKSGEQEQKIPSNLTAKKKQKKTLCLSKELSDITIKLKDSKGQDKTIPAHKSVLATNSSVFYEMFCDPDKSTPSELAIEDVTYEAFVKLLGHIYKDPIAIDVPVDELLAAATKYKITELETYYIKVMLEFIPTTPWALLQVGINQQIDQLKERAIKFICNNPEKAFQLEDFLNATEESLKLILFQDSLRLPEIKIFLNIVSWAEHKRKTPENKGKQLRTLIGEKLLHKIRFPQMTFEEFTKTELITQLLTKKEKTTVTDYFEKKKESGEEISTEPFSNRPRTTDS